jgi:hypothetical protein
LGDYDTALRYYEQFISENRYPALFQAEIEKIREKKAAFQPVLVECSDEWLRGILVNLTYVFSRLKKTIYAFVVENEEEYKSICHEELDQHDESQISQWEGWEAIGIYDNPNIHHLIFKKRALKTNSGFVGMCAHEIAHLELDDSGIRKSFRTFQNFTEENRLFNERLTDLYVISKGFGYELYCERKPNVGLNLLMSMEEIRDYIVTPCSVECRHVQHYQ